MLNSRIVERVRCKDMTLTMPKAFTVMQKNNRNTLVSKTCKCIQIHFTINIKLFSLQPITKMFFNVLHLNGYLISFLFDSVGQICQAYPLILTSILCLILFKQVSCYGLKMSIIY